MGPGRCLRSEHLTTDLWDHLDTLLERACDFNPANRFLDAAQMLEHLPTVVLARASAPTLTRTSADSIGLKFAEAVVLGCVISVCKDPDDSVSPQKLSEMKAIQTLDEFTVSMAIRQLIEIQFVEWVTFDGSYNNSWRELRVSGAGFKWAREHMESLYSSLDSSKPTEPRVNSTITESDDLPF